MQFDFYTMVLFALVLVFMALGISNFVEGKNKNKSQAFFGMLYIILGMALAGYKLTHM